MIKRDEIFVPEKPVYFVINIHRERNQDIRSREEKIVNDNLYFNIKVVVQIEDQIIDLENRENDLEAIFKIKVL